jgi:beta-lactamase regulating signal transducer with metallopeptidase domain
MDTLTLWLGDRLLIGSLQGAVVIAAVWLVCRLVPRIPAAAQSALWWLVALKLLLTFAPLPALPVPLLPAAFEQQTERVLLPPLTTGAIEKAFALPTTPPVNQINTWLPAAIVLWFGILLVQIGRLVHAHRVLRGIVTRSVLWPDETTSELANRLGLKRVPQVRLSDEIETPQVFGLREPVVLLPTEMTAFTAEERAMTLCHELMHIRRRDLTLGWVPACAERLFFFHPLARLAAREYVAARESACDAAAVRALGVSVTDYGRLLIRLGIGHVGPALAAGGSPFSASSLKRRLNMLQRLGTPALSRRWRWAIALAAAVVIPLQLVARTHTPQEPLTWQQSPESVVFKADHSGKEKLFLAHIHRVVGRFVRSAPSFDVHTFFKTFFAKESQKINVAVQDRPVELLTADELKRRVVQKQKTKELDRNKVEKMKLIEVEAQQERASEGQRVEDLKRKLIEMERELERAKSVEQAADEAKLRDVVRATEARAQAERAVEVLRRSRTPTSDSLITQLRELERQQEILNKQLQEMTKRHEDLRAQQRHLMEDLERLRRQSAQPK